MAMVGVASGSLQMDSQPGSFGLVWGSAAAWRGSIFIIWTGWTLAVALPRWQHHKHWPWYSIIIIIIIINVLQLSDTNDLWPDPTQQIADPVTCSKSLSALRTACRLFSYDVDRFAAGLTLRTSTGLPRTVMNRRPTCLAGTRISDNTLTCCFHFCLTNFLEATPG